MTTASDIALMIQPDRLTALVDKLTVNPYVPPFISFEERRTIIAALLYCKEAQKSLLGESHDILERP